MATPPDLGPQENAPANRPARSAPPAGGRARRARVWLKRAAIALFVLCALGLTLFLLRAPLLAAVARTWVINDSLTKADAIVILGGRPDLRAPAAARLFHEGLAPLILFMNVQASPSVEMGIIPSEEEQTRRLLLSNNVPESGMLALGDSVSSTFEESRAVRDWLQKTGAKSIIVATDLSHTRRARWIFRKSLKGLPVEVRIDAVAPQGYDVTNWWLHEEGLIAFETEFVKSIYYHCKY